MEVEGRRPRDDGRHAGMEPGQTLSFGCGMKFQKSHLIIHSHFECTHVPADSML